METAGPGMSMNKTIHRAVRRDLARFRDALDAFRDGDRERAAALDRAWANFDDQLTDHHQGEHAVAWPALAAIGVPGSTIDAFDVEHEAMAADLAAAGEAMARLRTSASRSDADVAAAAAAAAGDDRVPP
jgi:hemerythrin-like domain-containing protein